MNTAHLRAMMVATNYVKLGVKMENLLNRFLEYLTIEKHVSANTASSYLRDARAFLQYLNFSTKRELKRTKSADIER